jgi:NADH dehydrogenase
MNNVYALGDLAYMETPKYPKGHPQVASVAIAQADVLAKNLRLMESKSNRIYEFEYHDKGSMATVGRNLAVVDIPKPKLHYKGFFAWFIWMSLHLFLILGVKNKLMIFINWMYNYFTYDQNLRLIFKEFYRPKKSAQVATSSQPEVRPSQDWSPTKPVEQKKEDDDLRQAASFNR